MRPPSALSGRAQREKGEALLQQIEIPAAPVLNADETLLALQKLDWPGAARRFLSEEKLAAATAEQLSYIRQAWGNSAGLVAPEAVAAIRAVTAGRALPWRAEELLEQREHIARGTIIRPAANGSFILPAKVATVFGRVLAYRESLNVLAPWRAAEELAEWRIEVGAAGRYRAFVTLAADDVSSGNRFAVKSSQESVVGAVPHTGGYGNFQELAVGEIAIAAGKSRIMMAPHGALRRELADVRSIRLAPLVR